MVRNGRTLDNDTLVDKGGGTFSTENKLDIQSEWNNKVYDYVDNYFFRSVEVSVFDLDDSILASTDIIERCNYKDSRCFSKLGIIVWKVDDFKTCRLVEVGDSVCIFSRSHGYSRLSCEELQISMHDITEVEMCGHTFGYTSQGYFFAQHVGGDISQNVSLAKHVLEVITRRRRSKRDVSAVSEIDPVESLINARITHAIEKHSHHINERFHITHHKICTANRQLWIVLIGLAKVGDVSLFVQTIYNDASLRAYLSGDALSVIQCKTITKYRFVKRKKCCKQHPIEYVDGNDRLLGYVSPLTHYITSSATELSEPCPEFYFKTHKETLHITNGGAVAVNIPSVPISVQGSKDYIELPPITFNAHSDIYVTGQEIFKQESENQEKHINDYQLSWKLKNTPKIVDTGSYSNLPFTIITGGVSWIWKGMSKLFSLFSWYWICVIAFLFIINMILSMNGIPAFQISFWLIRCILTPVMKPVKHLIRILIVFIYGCIGWQLSRFYDFIESPIRDCLIALKRKFETSTNNGEIVMVMNQPNENPTLAIATGEVSQNTGASTIEPRNLPLVSSANPPPGLQHQVPPGHIMLPVEYFQNQNWQNNVTPSAPPPIPPKKWYRKIK